jgi:radical SAM protein with 4Fe4S-binding SPASM domain
MTSGFEESALEGRPVLAVMAKSLVRGTVKTRLAAQIGDDEALAVYQRLLHGTLAQAESVKDVDLVLAVAIPSGATGRVADSPDNAPSTLAGSPSDPLADRSAPWHRLTQHGDTLGARLAAVFADLFAAGAASVVAVNSDSPVIPLAYLEQGFAHLAAAPTSGRIVLGPATDGGYYLVGLDATTWTTRGDAIAALLASSPMSTAALLTHTLRAAKACGMEVVQLPLWMDIDEPADLAVLARLDGDAPLRGEPSAGLREIYLHVTHRCGRDCRHCYNKDSAWDPGELTTAEWKDAIDQSVALGASSFVFIGGDPLLRDDFVELLDHITGTHQAHARFFFNSYVDEAAAAELSRAGRGLLRPLASIDGPHAINDALRGPGSYDDIMASMANLLAVGLQPVANTVLVRPALPGLAQLARELRAAGISRLHLILPHQQGGLPNDLELVPSGEEMLAALRELLATATEVGLVVDNISSWRRRLGSRNDLCASGCRDLAIDPYGEVHACVITAGDPAFVAGSLREQGLETIWRASSSLRLLRAARARDRAECHACPVVDACGGECWVQSHYAARAHDEPAGYTAPFPYCDLVRPMLLELQAEADEAVRQATHRTTAAPAGADCVAAGACGGQAAAGSADYALFDCI